MKKVSTIDPHSGGIKIPTNVQIQTKNRILRYAEKHFSGKFNHIDVYFRGHFCYIDAYTEPIVQKNFDEKLFKETREAFMERLRNTPTHLCRLRYFGDENQWSMAFYTYSNEKYSPCAFRNGSFYGTPEEAFEISSVYLCE
jgi:hypothetical protein